jgi:digeranylgeranylglycerophospholipid reductase
MKDYISGFQYEMARVENLDMNHIHLWFGNEVAPKGYLWVFPKGESLANVGIGIIGTANEQKSAREHLDGFIMAHPEFFKKAAPVEVNSGGVPVSGMISDSFVKDNFLLVGDSAQMVNPIHGGGMSTNLYAGMIAGRVIDEAIRSGDCSQEKLFEYEKEWRDTDGVRMAKLLKLRLFLENLTDDDFEYFANALTGENIMDMQKGKVKFMFKMLIKHPRLLNLARKYFAGF